MTTPTEELARPHGTENELPRGGEWCISFTAAGLQALREAVEAESDAERMKQPAVAWGWEHPETKELCGVQKIRKEYPEYRGNFHLDGVKTVDLYAQPFPSTKQLQQRVKELEAALRRIEGKERSPLNTEVLTMGASDYEWLEQSENTISHLAEIAAEALANTQGDKK